MIEAGADFPSSRTVPRGRKDLFDLSPNERSILSIIQKAGSLPSAEIARLSGLSAQSASVITRALEADELIVKGEPVRGKVGKPLTPFLLNHDGAYSLGLRIGRRSADMVLLDLCGRVRGHIRETYPYPTPGRIVEFARASMETLVERIPVSRRDRIAGLGIGAPFELWNWLDVTLAPQAEMMAWKDFQFEVALAEFTDFPITIGNDASVACSGEHAFGVGVEFTDFIYFYVGSLLGGGIVLNDRLLTGQNGNAAAFGSLPIRTKDGSWQQLNAHASVVQLEEALEARHPGRSLALLQASEWVGFDDLLEDWLNHVAESLGYAMLTMVAAFDVADVIVDCGIPARVKAELIGRVQAIIATADSRGIERPRVIAGSLGPMAGALGASYQPIVTRLLIDGSP